MKRRFLFYMMAALLTAGCAEKGQDIRNGDLVFVGLPAEYEAAGSSMDAAISAATGADNQLNITHVAMIEKARDGLWIIDATPRLGVTRRPLATFLEENRLEDGSCPELIVKRVKGVDADAAVARAKTLFGCAYDLRFLPDNDEFYCSELIQECYLDARGEPVFDSQPMNFLAPDGTMPPYWEELFRKLGMDVPQGVPGTNPQRLSESERLITVSNLEF